MLLLMSFCVCASVLTFASGKLLDMSYKLDSNSLYWPSGQKAFLLTLLTKGMTQNGFWLHSDEMESGTHVGTHMDAPCHFYKNKWCIDEIPIDRLVALPAVMIDIRQRAAQSPDSNITLEDVVEFEKVNGKIARGAVVVQCSGWADKYPNRSAIFGNDRNDTTDFHFPSFGLDAAEFLIDKRGVVGLAVDTPSLDYGPSETYPVHQYMAKHNVYGLEYVKKTCSLPPVGATLIISPSPMRGSSGAPTRIHASWDEKSATSGGNGGNTVFSHVLLICLILELITC